MLIRVFVEPSSLPTHVGGGVFNELEFPHHVTFFQLLNNLDVWVFFDNENSNVESSKRKIRERKLLLAFSVDM